ncbi:hypothetical protein SRHO_G00222200 [Serrasalmus rhombeus]
MPYRMWAFRLLCKESDCHRASQRPMSNSLYKTVRRVLDIDGWYFMATEYLECHRCWKKVAGHPGAAGPYASHHISSLLTYRLSYDMEVVWLYEGEVPRQQRLCTVP